jgi:hypothetical protein
VFSRSEGPLRHPVSEGARFHQVPFAIPLVKNSWSSVTENSELTQWATSRPLHHVHVSHRLIFVEAHRGQAHPSIVIGMLPHKLLTTQALGALVFECGFSSSALAIRSYLGRLNFLCSCKDSLFRRAKSAQAEACGPEPGPLLKRS